MRAKSMSSPFVCLAVASAFFFAEGADPVSISGTVKDQAGKAISGAVVTLKGASMSAISNLTGAYTLTGNAATLLRSADLIPNMQPHFGKKGIAFNVTENVARVRIDIMDLRGRFVQGALDRPLVKGSYSVFPAFGPLSPGIYAVSVSIGTARTFFKLPLTGDRAHNAIASGQNPGFTETSRPASALSKGAAAADTIMVSATGYTTIRQSIDSYTGTHDFVLQPGYTLIYFRLRIEYINKGDWSGLLIKDSAEVIKVRRMALTGNPMASEAKFSHLGLNQSDSAFKAGGSASETVDFALTPEALNTPFLCRLDKGVAGSDTLRFYGVSGAKIQLLKQVATITGVDISVDLPWLKSCPPVEAPMAPVSKMGLALYYPWYYTGSWTSNQLLDHPLTLYDSGDTLAIARQMDQAKSAGITGFLESWAGPGSDSDKKLKLLLKVAQQKDFKIGIFFELLGDGGAPRNTDTIYNWFSYLVSTYRDNPAMLEVNKKPIAVPYCANYVPCATWKSILDKLHAAGLDLAVIFNQDPGDSLFIFDGVNCDPSISLGRAVRYYAALADSPAAKIYIATAMPGFDERLIPGRTGRYTDRQNGQLFTTRLQAAVNCNPNWLEAYTWNEWWENTYIEPSVNYGDQYLQIFGSFVKPWLTQ
jgi:hypothetical protein